VTTGKFVVDTTNLRQELRGIKDDLRTLMDRVDAQLEATKQMSISFIPDEPPPET
jgi:hypothetical protein